MRTRGRMMACVTARFLTMTVLSASVAMGADMGTDPAHKYAWGENVGWANAGPTNHEVMVHYYEGTGGWLSGHAWCENIGWIVMGSAEGGPYANTTSNNWGVNLAANGDLSGYAWGENVGWINFGHAQCDAAIDPANGEFSGHAWGENIGWLKFKGASPDYGVRLRLADLALSMGVNRTVAFSGETLVYTMLVSNTGPSEADGVQVTDLLPDGVTPSGIWITNLGSIAQGSTTSFSLPVTVDRSTRGILTNSASIASSAMDTNTLDNSATIQVLITPRGSVLVIY